MAARINGPKAEGKETIINIIFSDLKESYVLQIENAVLHHKKMDPDPNANATLKLTYALYLNMAIGAVSIKETLFSNDLEVEGSKITLVRFFALFDRPKGNYNIITP